MTKPKILLSHSHKDQDIAEIIAKAVRRITLGQIEIWFSSDSTGSGGIGAGDIWLNTIKDRLKESSGVITLLTPASLNRPWIYFESGVGAAKEGCGIIPVCVGIDSINEVPFPLAMYEGYQLSNYDSFKNFVAKLLARFSVPFDEEMAKPVLENSVEEIIGVSQNKWDQEEQTASSSTIEDIKKHIDRRFFELAQLQEDGGGKEEAKSKTVEYSIPIEIDLPGFKYEDFLVITHEMTIQHVLDNIFWMIRKQVNPFSYLLQWVLVESNRNCRLIVKEVAGFIPARVIFKPDGKWKVVALETPYSPKDSGLASIRMYDPNKKAEE